MSDTENLSIETKLKSLKLSKTLQQTKKELESNFGLYLQGHTSGVTTVAITSDNKYIISGSSDKTIRI